MLCFIVSQHLTQCATVNVWLRNIWNSMLCTAMSIYPLEPSMGPGTFCIFFKGMIPCWHFQHGFQLLTLSCIAYQAALPHWRPFWSPNTLDIDHTSLSMLIPVFLSEMSHLALCLTNFNLFKLQLKFHLLREACAWREPLKIYSSQSNS